MKWQLTSRFVMLVLVLVGGVARMSAQTFTVDDIEYEVTNAGEVMAKYYYGDGGHVNNPGDCDVFWGKFQSDEHWDGNFHRRDWPAFH